VLPTYLPGEPDRNPMFLEKRVYQGSSGRVYPLPVIDRIAEKPVDRDWDAIYLDNGLVEVMMLPEIGGRIHAAKDLTNGYDMIYRQHVIKPALVGLAGPWVSGGVEFNWPQHHRPSTFMPAQVAIEESDDGSITVWMGEHDPMDRTKGMHGVCLHPGRSVIEIKARLYNRTPYAQTFLWWMNVGTHVHEAYKSFFPPDARAVADHAKRATSSYPLCDGFYYGVDYASRGRDGIPENERPRQFLPAHGGGSGPCYAPNDLSWYANIPVPTSYMCVGTEGEFVGGYDFYKEAGLLLVADHHIAPGKKQWTWGNQEFGYAWDRNLTEADGPYIELMAGVFTDNQPDFSYIGPGETRTFSQFMAPYQKIGPVHFANADAAISVTPTQVGVAVTRAIRGLIVVHTDSDLHEWALDLEPGHPLMREVDGAIRVELRELLETPKKPENYVTIALYERADPAERQLQPATEPPLPAEVESADELFLIGQHLEQYRHATRSSADYWQEALRRDPGDVRCNNAMGLWRLRRGEFEIARQHFQAAIDRATRRNPNPYDGEPFYNLGLALRFLNREREAFDAFAKATWNAAWQAPAYQALGELSCRQGDMSKALNYLDRAIRKDQDNLKARNLRAMILRKLGREASVEGILALDPLDQWARHLSGEPVFDNQVRIDLAIDFHRAGMYAEALALLEKADFDADDGTVPLIAYYRAYTLGHAGQDASEAYRFAASMKSDYTFPARLEDIAVLESAPETDPRAAYYLGNLLYDRRRYDEAIACWERSIRIEPDNSIAHRNLGIAGINVLNDPKLALEEYDEAIRVAPDDARLWYERDQLWKRLGRSPEERLTELRRRPDLVDRRDDLTIQFCSLLNAAGNLEEAARILDHRTFQPWEGGEGMALGIFSRTHLGLGRQALSKGEGHAAKAHFERVANPPRNLGEARHLLSNGSDIWLLMGDACAMVGSREEAERWWGRAADFKGDFQGMAVQPFSELTMFQAEALRRLGLNVKADALLADLQAYAERLEAEEAKIDYFATSLPTMLLFNDDLQVRQVNRARYIRAQVALQLGETAEARRLLDQVLAADPNHELALDMRASLKLPSSSHPW